MSLGLRHSESPYLVAYGLAVVAVIIATVVTMLLFPWIQPSVSLLFFPAIVLPAMYGGYGPALVATVLSTASLAYFLVPPLYSFDIGVDDAIRLAVFVLVAVSTAWLSSGRREAEAAQRRSVKDLQSAVTTLRKVSGWPVLIGIDTTASLQRMLAHAAAVVDARGAVAGWESEDEPWLYVADSSFASGVTKHVQADLAELVADRYPSSKLMTAAFRTEHLSGSVFLVDASSTATDLTAAVELVAREVGNSLDQLYVAERLRQLAVREDRLRLSRDLHDGVLQSLTGIRLELQAIAEGERVTPEAHARLLAIERALAIEQRELRMFIEELRPGSTAPVRSGHIAQQLEDMCSRLSAEWKAPITLRIEPRELALAQTIEQAIRLMVHEAIVNALKHAHPSRVAVTVDASEHELRIAVADDGRGFTFKGRLDHEKLIESNLGPASLRDRVTALDGRLTVESSATGSRVEFVVPVAAHQA